MRRTLYATALAFALAGLAHPAAALVRGLGVLPIRFSWGTADTQGRALRDALDDADRNMYALKRLRAAETPPRGRPPPTRGRPRW